MTEIVARMHGKIIAVPDSHTAFVLLHEKKEGFELVEIGSQTEGREALAAPDGTLEIGTPVIVIRATPALHELRALEVEALQTKAA